VRINQAYPYHAAWKQQLITALSIALVVAFLLLFLQPFDTYQTSLEGKNWKLMGYALCVFLIYLLNHGVEKIVIKSKVWMLRHEILSLGNFMLLTLWAVYVNHNITFKGPELSFAGFLNFTLHFSFPFMLLILVLTGYMRFRFGQLSLEVSDQELQEVRIWNDTKTASFICVPDRLLFIEANQNYVIIHQLNEQREAQQTMLRNTLASIAESLPFVTHCHRSFLVNLKNLNTLVGNKRNARLSFHVPNIQVPVSQHYYDAMKSYLQNRPS